MVAGSEPVLDFFSNSDLKDDTGFCRNSIQQSSFQYIFLALLTMEAASVPSSGSTIVWIFPTASVRSQISMQS